GLLADGAEAPKFRFGKPVSNEPEWRLVAGLGIGAAFLIFLSAALGAHYRPTATRTWRTDLSVALTALASGLTIGLAALSLPIESVEPGDRLRSLAIFALAAAPLAACFALTHGDHLPGFDLLLDPSRWRRKDLISLVLAGLFAATMIAAMHVALGLVFDPRYKDFPLAALTGPVVAFAVLGFSFAGTLGSLRPRSAEILAAAVLAGSALFIIANEGIANWQALLFASLLIVLALTLLQAEAGQSSTQAG
ncbi:MAG: beta-(1-6) glucans synthase, partial [Actinomycetota bacterium]